MEVRAVAKNIRVSPRKVRPLVDMIRGKKVDTALNILQFAPTPTARAVAKVVKSAAANAETNFQMIPSDLKIVNTYVDEAPRMKRHRPGARARVKPIIKRSSHITVIVAEKGAE
jgi:large subunit ribosomal protein L22